jgi:hypothetical protein
METQAPNMSAIEQKCRRPSIPEIMSDRVVKIDTNAEAPKSLENAMIHQALAQNYIKSLLK